MIFIVVKFETKPEWADRWPDFVAAFTAATPGREGQPVVRVVAQPGRPGRVRAGGGVPRR